MALLEELTSAELAEWQDYFALEPFGPHQEDFRAIATALLVLNAFLDKDAEPIEVLSLFPHFEEHVDEDELLASLPDSDELQRKLRALAAAWGAVKPAAQ